MTATASRATAATSAAARKGNLREPVRSPGGGDTEEEECDDGNTDDGDGCSSTCTCEELAGDVGGDAQSAAAFDFDAERTESIFGCGDADMWRLEVAETGMYAFFTESDVDPVCTIENEAGDVLTGDDDGGDELNCRVSMPLTAGEVYYLKVDTTTPNGAPAPLRSAGRTRRRRPRRRRVGDAD